MLRSFCHLAHVQRRSWAWAQQLVRWQDALLLLGLGQERVGDVLQSTSDGNRSPVARCGCQDGGDELGMLLREVRAERLVDLVMCHLQPADWVRHRGFLLAKAAG